MRIKKQKLVILCLIIVFLLMITIVGIIDIFAALKANLNSDINVMFEAQSVLKTGQEINQIIKGETSYAVVDEDINSITFDYDSDSYSTIKSSAVTATSVDKNDSQSIMIYEGTDNDVYILSEKEIIAPQDCSKMFYNMTSLNEVNFNNFNTENVTDMSYMFYGCSNISTPLVPDTSNVENMSYMYANSGLSVIDSIPWSFDSAIYVNSMFENCDNLPWADMRYMAFSEAVNASKMFYDCDSLIWIDFYDNGSTTDPLFRKSINETVNIEQMFAECDQLVRIYANDWHMTYSDDYVTHFSGYSVFENSSCLIGGIPYQTYSSNNISYSEARIDYGYFTSYINGFRQEEPNERYADSDYDYNK